MKDLDQQLLDRMEHLGKEAVRKAGALIRERLGTPATVERKDRFDYVTDVDQACQNLIIQTIAGQFAEHHILSEEAERSQWQSGISWIVDPLDGTTNFIHGIPFVAVSIAAAVEGKIVLGFVLDPLRDELFRARLGRGAYLNDKRLNVHRIPSLSDALVATGFPFREKQLIDPYLSTFKRIFQKVSDVRRAGSAALDLSYLAAGRLDGFWELGLSPWDVAAGSLMIEEAGGRVSDFWGRRDFVKNGHIVAGSQEVYPFLLEHVRVFLAPSLEPIP
jgi:myo-inositol-1(or 4)-monophosphatase